jgi:hypothetical protein
VVASLTCCSTFNAAAVYSTLQSYVRSFRFTCGSLYTVEAAVRLLRGLTRICSSRVLACVLLLLLLVHPCCCTLLHMPTRDGTKTLVCSVKAAMLAFKLAAAAEGQQDTCLSWQAWCPRGCSLTMSQTNLSFCSRGINLGEVGAGMRSASRAACRTHKCHVTCQPGRGC